MKRKRFKKILLYTASVFLLLVAVLCIHIYMVTRPKAPDANTRIMARIDIRQDINQADADKITTWMYQQKGVDHVLCNPQSAIVVFTFAPVKTSADLIVSHFKSSLHFPAQRIVPTAEEMQNGCPVSPTSKTYRVYHFFKKLI